MLPESSPWSANFLDALWQDIQRWSRELGFQQVGISDGNLDSERERLEYWLDQGYQGDMLWLGEHIEKRLQPPLLVPDCKRVISLRMDYLPEDTRQIEVLKSPSKAYISRYALGRDYHRLIRKRLAKLAQQIEQAALKEAAGCDIQQRPFVDSAPVLERPLAEKAGLGWIGKHTLLLHPKAGSWFFLGEVMTNLPLPLTETPLINRCGECVACLKICPTDAFPRPYELDARRCISYLTIENKGPIPEEFREPIGNRVFGCDDCQAICPWNRYASPTQESDFSPRHQLDSSELSSLFLWSEDEFLRYTEGSAIRRVGHERWLRNLAIGLGNAPTSEDAIDALNQRREHPSELVREHVEWALNQQSTPNRKRRRKLRRTHSVSNSGDSRAP